MMSIDQVKEKLNVLAKEHEVAPDDFDGAFYTAIEEAAEDFIVAYCESKGYLVDGFPTEKRKYFENAEENDEMDDYFCRERFQLYLALLTIAKPDVAELMYYYESQFYYSLYDDFENYIEVVKESIHSFDVTLQ